MRSSKNRTPLWAGPRSQGLLQPPAYRQRIAPPRVQRNLAARHVVRMQPQGAASPPVAPVEQPGMRSEKMQSLEAVLLLAHEPLPSRKLSQYANLADGTEALTLIRQLNRLYDTEDRAFRVEQLAGGFQLLTRPALADWVRRLAGTPPEVRLSSPALETLAVVAYRQPVLRAEVEAIRGVACGEMIRQLMERDLVRIAGRSEELGRPFLYGTTNRFLQVFGLAHLDDLPRSEALRRALFDNQTTDTTSADISGMTKEGSTVTMTQSGTTMTQSSATSEEKNRRQRAEADELRVGLGVVAVDDDEDEEFSDDDDVEDDDDEDEDEDDLEDDDEEDEDFDDDYDEDFDDDDDEEWEDDEDEDEDELADEEADGEWEEVEDDEADEEEEEDDDEEDEDEDEDDDWGDEEEEEDED